MTFSFTPAVLHQLPLARPLVLSGWIILIFFNKDNLQLVGSFTIHTKTSDRLARKEANAPSMCLWWSDRAGLQPMPVQEIPNIKTCILKKKNLLHTAPLLITLSSLHTHNNLMFSLSLLSITLINFKHFQLVVHRTVGRVHSAITYYITTCITEESLSMQYLEHGIICEVTLSYIR